ncbi:MarR family winged helix-turn-helix transcriptional regulator [Corynebacterium pacaense]|uniref:MarR family winged helix-turn-helix transcriptional regulator n=1 Tax=Corynebacterium pacaense TaxID=1816684 RepID=UPI0009BBA8D7|nr:MarR family winged helix-turn-helix transcriptional regulator [Corynebacterium pacaense]
MTSERTDSPGVPENPWLTPEEHKVWLDLWSLRVWLPAQLDAQLKADSGLSHFEYFTMAHISMAPEKQLRMSELAELSDMTLSHLSRVVSRLEKSGWVIRRPDPSDGRATVAVLTDAGWEKVQAAAPGHVWNVRKLIFNHLNEEELKVLDKALEKLVNSLNPQRPPRT